MTLRARLAQAERRAGTRAQETELVAVVVRLFGDVTSPPAELMQERRAEAWAAGQSLAVVFWSGEGELQ